MYRRLGKKEDSASMDYIGVINMIEDRIDMISKIALAHRDIDTLILLKESTKLLSKLRENEKMLREVRKSERQLVEAFFAEKDKTNGNG